MKTWSVGNTDPQRYTNTCYPQHFISFKISFQDLLSFARIKKKTLQYKSPATEIPTTVEGF